MRKEFKNILKNVKEMGARNRIELFEFAAITFYTKLVCI